ncbi:MAG TPA: 2-oxoglutarate dehydrogenase E1 component, partial [Vicingus sp.]|nr:2-oxoglutarate dehydrogenase E1 component [Vicingus sp.]
MDKHSYLSNADVSAIEEYYQQFLNNPDNVGEGWKKFFEGFEFARKNYDTELPEGFDKEFKVIELINGYRSRGHLFTKTNPVRARRQYSPTLAIENFGLLQSDLETVFQAGNEVGIGPAKLKDIIAHLEQTYCQSIGVEFMYIRKPEEVAWIKSKIELKNKVPFDTKAKKHILHKLNQAVVFEQFLHKKFVGQKRFSLEGNEALIPALDALVEHGADFGIKEFIVGMAHRGRLNVLANIFNKTYENIFSEFEGKEYEDNVFDGDVKYHLGYSCDVKTDNGHDIHMTLAP